MKIITIILSVVLIAINANAQVTIGASLKPMDGVLLDLKEKNSSVTDPSTTSKGFMLPKVALTDLNSLTDIGGVDTTQVELYAGLTIYNIKNSNAIPSGLYIWNGQAWNTLNNPDPLEFIYSSGIFNKQSSNNNWSGIMTGTKDAKLEFIGRCSRGAQGFTFTLLYPIDYPMVIVQDPVMSAGSASISELTNDSFKLSVTITGGTTSFIFTLTTDAQGYTTIVATPDIAGGWIQGTWKSTPNKVI